MGLGVRCNFAVNLLKIVCISLSLCMVLSDDLTNAGLESSEESNEVIAYIVSAVGCAFIVAYIIKGRYDTICSEHASEVERINKVHIEQVQKLQEEHEKLVEQHKSDIEALNKEKQQLKEQEECTVKRLKDQFASQLKEIAQSKDMELAKNRIESNSNIQDLLEKLKEDHAHEKEKLEQKYQERICKLEDKIDALEKRNDLKEEKLCKKYEERIENIRQDHLTEKADLKKDYEAHRKQQEKLINDHNVNLKSLLATQIEQLREDHEKQKAETEKRYRLMLDKAEKHNTDCDRLRDKQLRQCYEQMERARNEYETNTKSMREDRKYDIDTLRKEHELANDKLRQNYMATSQQLRQDNQAVRDKQDKAHETSLKILTSAVNDHVRSMRESNQQTERMGQQTLTVQKDMFEAAQRDRDSERSKQHQLAKDANRQQQVCHHPIIFVL